LSGSRRLDSSSRRNGPLDQASAECLSFRQRIDHPDLQGLYDYWLARSGATGVMARDDLDPTDFPTLLKNLILAEVGDAGREIRYRLVGTEIAAAHGYDFTGWTIEQLTSGPTMAFAQQLYGKVVENVAPVYSEGRFRWQDKEFHWTKRLHLPMSMNGDDTVDLVLLGQFFEMTRKEEELLITAQPEEIAADRQAISR